MDSQVLVRSKGYLPYVGAERFILLIFEGLGMLITDSVEKAIDFVDSQGQLHVVQKYIENPLLLDGDRKFDIRWAFVRVRVL